MNFQPSVEATDFFSEESGSTRGLAPAWREHEGYLLYRVRDMSREMYVGPVHNIEVEGEHSYLVEGLAVHNCGHPSLDPTGGVTFIEASWVANPAFTGARIRNILSTDAVTARTARRIEAILSSPPPVWTDDGLRKAASVRIDADTIEPQDAELASSVTAFRSKTAQGDEGFDFGDEEGGGDDAGGGDSTPVESNPDMLKDLEESLTKEMLSRVERRVRDEMTKHDSSSPTSIHNEDVIKTARRTYSIAAAALVKTASSDIEAVDRLAAFDGSLGIPLDQYRTIYRTVLKVGSASRYPSLDDYLRACRGALGRQPDEREGRILTRIGRLLSLRRMSSAPPPDTSRSQ